MLADMKLEGLTYTGKYYTWKDKHFMASLNDLERTDDLFALPRGGVTVAIAAYIEEVRGFRYGDKKQFEAMEIMFEIEGVGRKAVKWGVGNEKKVPKEIKALQPNSIAILTLTKYKEDRPFAIERVDLIAEPFVIEEIKEEESK